MTKTDTKLDRVLEWLEDNWFYIIIIALGIWGTSYVLVHMPLPPHWTRLP